MHVYSTLDVRRYFGALAPDGVSPIEGALPVNVQLVKMVYPNMDGIQANVGFTVAKLPAKYFDTKINELSGNLTIIINNNIIKFNANMYPDPQKTVISISGDQTNYPFSRYEGAIVVTASFSSNIKDIKKNPTNFTIPVALCIIDDTYGVDVTSFYDVNAPYPKDDWNIHFFAKHSPIFMVYPITSMCMMALIGITLVFAAYTVSTSPYSVIKDTKAFLPALAALIFAIPKYRMELPFAPPLGSLIDYVIFYWVNLMPVIAFVVVIWKHLINILGEQVDLQATEDEKAAMEAREKAAEEKAKHKYEVVQLADAGFRAKA
jgi:hypothetical protein